MYVNMPKALLVVDVWDLRTIWPKKYRIVAINVECFDSHLQATKSVYTVRDDSGHIDAIQWKDETSTISDGIEEGSYVRIIGSVR